LLSGALVRATSVLGGLHHEYSLAATSVIALSRSGRRFMDARGTRDVARRLDGRNFCGAQPVV
jgi:hypothetical protein